MKLDSALGRIFYFKLSDPQKNTNTFLRKHFFKKFQNYRIMLDSDFNEIFIFTNLTVL